MSQLKFDHSKETLSESMGFDSTYLEGHSEKCSKISTKIITHGLKGSHVAEEIANTFSYNDLVYATTMFIIKATEDALINNPMIAMMAALVDKQEKE